LLTFLNFLTFVFYVYGSGFYIYIYLTIIVLPYPITQHHNLGYMNAEGHFMSLKVIDAIVNIIPLL